jgi:hypothetical protein
MTEMSPLDREALKRALKLARAESEAEREHLAGILSRQGWQEAATRAAYFLQCRALRLKPWQAPPLDCNGESAPGVYGCQPEEAAALVRRMLAAGLSIFDPDPLGALERAESACRDERVGGGKPDRAQPPSSQPEPQ